MEKEKMMEIPKETLESAEITSMSPVIIEELDKNTMKAMNINIAEFKEASPLKVGRVIQNLEKDDEENVEYDVMELENVDIANVDIVDEDRLTTQFINGQITFSEYSSTLENEEEVDEPEIPRSEPSTSLETSEPKKQKNPKKVPIRKRRRHLPPHLQGLMGEANVRCAKGETELASQMCLEIIRQVPSAPEPFQTLAMIYEATEPEKSLQFALIAAHLSPKDADQWTRLAMLSLEAGNKKQAITCYSKAIMATPTDASLYEARATLQEEVGDKKSSFRGYLKLINQLGSNEPELIMKYAKMLAKRFMEEKNYEQALQAMDNVFSKCSDHVTLSEVNVIIEALIALKQFRRCLDLLTQYTEIWVKYGDVPQVSTVGFNIKQEMNLRMIEACGIPNGVAVDLKAKCLVVLIELDAVDIAIEYLPKLYECEDPETEGDLFLDVAEALMAKKRFEYALLLLEPLVNSKNFCMAAVWLRQAECWIGCGDVERAMRSYEVVRELSPQHFEARIELAKLYEERGQLEASIDVLCQDPRDAGFDPDVIFRRTLLLKKAGRYDEYFESGFFLFSRHCLVLRSRSEMSAMSRATGLRQRQELLNLHRLSRGESLEDENMANFINTESPAFVDEYGLFVEMLETACKLKRYGLMQKLSFSALTSKKFDQRSAHLMYLCLLTCIHNHDSFHGFNLVREMVRTDPRANYWNLLNIIIQRAEDSRHNRFIMRLLGREGVFSQLHILHANNCLVSGTYKYALNDYISLFKIEPTALLALLIGVTHLQMACQKFAAQKNQIVVQAIAFMQKYAQLRGKDVDQEINYNMGRLFHQLGLLPTAVHYYKLVLTASVSKLVQEKPNLLDLKQEAAYNLHLIYSQSENHNLARMYLEKYIVI